MKITHTVCRWYQDWRDWPNRPTAADALAIAAAVSIPWSTSLTSILVMVWLVAVLPGSNVSNIHRTLISAPSYMPILIVVLAVAGMIWTEASPPERLAGLRQFLKLLAIPILLIQFSESEKGKHVIIGFLISCIALLGLSIASAIWPVITWWRPGNPGVPFKDQTAQSTEFTLCAFCLIAAATNAWRARHYAWVIALFTLSATFLGDVVYIATARTELVAIGVLVILSCAMAFAWKGIPIGIAVVGILAMAAWFSSPYLEGRVRHGEWEFQQYVGEHRPTSIGLRLDWWRQSVHYWKTAPIIGYGTGSVEEVFKRGAAERGMAGPQFVTTDPHSQIMAMAVQFGIVGVAALFAMWLVHIRLFLVSGPIAWFGLVVVIQNIVGCIFNSHIKDFTEGWIYVFGVGVLGGLVQRRQVVWQAITGDCATNRIDVADRGCTPSVPRS